jgi:hypothetical protein
VADALGVEHYRELARGVVEHAGLVFVERDGVERDHMPGELLSLAEHDRRGDVRDTGKGAGAIAGDGGGSSLGDIEMLAVTGGGRATLLLRISASRSCVSGPSPASTTFGKSRCVESDAARDGGIASIEVTMASGSTSKNVTSAQNFGKSEARRRILFSPSFYVNHALDFHRNQAAPSFRSLRKDMVSASNDLLASVTLPKNPAQPAASVTEPVTSFFARAGSPGRPLAITRPTAAARSSAASSRRPASCQRALRVRGCQAFQVARTAHR